MSVDYSKYPATGLSSTMHNVGIRNGATMYSYMGERFGVGLDKNIALCWTEHPLWYNMHYPQDTDIIHTYIGYPTFGLKIQDRLKTRAYSVYVDDRNNNNNVIGYNYGGNAYPTNYSGTATINRNSITFYSGYEPRRCFIACVQNALPSLGLSSNPAAPVWVRTNTLFDTSLYDAKNAEQWVMSIWLRDFADSSVHYVNSDRFNPDSLSNINTFASKRFEMYVDNMTTDALLLCGGGGSIATYTITYKRADGSITVGSAPSKYTAFTNSNHWINGKMPDFPEINIKEMFDLHYPEIADDNHIGQKIIFIAEKNKWYSIHEIDGVETLMDSDGNVYDGGIQYVGACVQQMNSDVTVESVYYIYPVCHMSLCASAICALGVPVRTFMTTPASMFARNGDISAFYQSKIKNNGECTGEFFPLANNREQYQAITDASNIVFQDTEKIPINETPLEPPAFMRISKGVRTYVMDQGKINSFFEKIFSLPDNIVEIFKNYSTNVSEAIRNVTIFPISIPNYSETVNTNLTIYGEPIVEGIGELQKPSCVIDMGNYVVTGNNDFMDFEPYTQYYLYMPYVGMIKLDSRDVVGHSIGLKYVVEFLTGECRAIVFRDGCIIGEHVGMIGSNIPIVSRDYAAIMGNISNIIASFAGASSSIVSGAYSSNAIHNIPKSNQTKIDPVMRYVAPIYSTAGGFAGSTISALSSANIYRSSVSTSGESGTVNAFTMPQYPFILRIKSRYEVPENYGHSVGYVCEESGRIVDYTGYTVCDNVDCSGIPCLEEERNAIKSILESGVYL